jgi:hypothetical protein
MVGLGSLPVEPAGVLLAVPSPALGVGATGPAADAADAAKSTPTVSANAEVQILFISSVLPLLLGRHAVLGMLRQRPSY